MGLGRRIAIVLIGVAALVAGLIPASSAEPRWVDVIVVLDDPGASASEVARDHRVDVGYVYEHALHGFSGSVPEGRMNALQRDRRVDYVELDSAVELVAQTVPTGVERIFADDNAGLRIDGSDGAGERVDVDVAVIDTGIDLEHPDLNVESSVDCFYTEGGGPPWTRTTYCGPGGDDDHYHGTHVAGTIGALDNGEGVVGVAAGARLHAVKVLDSSGSGYVSNVIAGIDHVAANAGVIEVANMSLGGGYSQAENDAVAAAVDAGVVFAVAAGNSGANAGNYSPASEPTAITVSALADFDGEPGGLGQPTCRSDEDDTFANFSNYGSVVDIIAPGVCIESTFPLEKGAYDTISGTSMASPHVAGAAALLASGSNAPADGADVETLRDQLVNAGNLNWNNDDDPDGIQERLLDVTGFTATFSDNGGDAEPPPNAAPDASFTYDCTDLACDFDATGSSDSDGSIVAYDWDFGDGNVGDGETVSHSYAADGTYTVTLTVTDDDAATDEISHDVTVSAPAGGAGITLDVTTYKVRGQQHADLTWSGTTGDEVDIYRDGALVETIADNGVHTDSTDQRGGGSATYRVCEAGTSTCSGDVTATW